MRWGRPPASTTASGSTSRASASVLRITASFLVVTCTAPHPATLNPKPHPAATLNATGSESQLETESGRRCPETLNIFACRARTEDFLHIRN